MLEIYPLHIKNATTDTTTMRPESLFPLFKPVTSIKGIGPRIAVLVEKAAGPHVIDLCWHLPT